MIKDKVSIFRMLHCKCFDIFYLVFLKKLVLYIKGKIIIFITK